MAADGVPSSPVDHCMDLSVLLSIMRWRYAWCPAPLGLLMNKHIHQSFKSPQKYPRITSVLISCHNPGIPEKILSSKFCMCLTFIWIYKIWKMLTSISTSWIYWKRVVWVQDEFLLSGNSHLLAWILKESPSFAWLQMVFRLSSVKIESGHRLILNAVAHSGVSLACMAQPCPSGLFLWLAWLWPFILRHG